MPEDRNFGLTSLRRADVSSGSEDLVSGHVLWPADRLRARSIASLRLGHLARENSCELCRKGAGWESDDGDGGRNSIWAEQRAFAGEGKAGSRCGRSTAPRLRRTWHRADCPAFTRCLRRVRDRCRPAPGPAAIGRSGVSSLKCLTSQWLHPRRPDEEADWRRRRGHLGEGKHKAKGVARQKSPRRASGRSHAWQLGPLGPLGQLAWRSETWIHIRPSSSSSDVGLRP